MIITSSETKSKKYKQRQKRGNVLAAINHLKANLSNTPQLAASPMSICLPLSEGAIKWQEQTIRQIKPRIHLNQLFSWNDDTYLGEF